MNTPLDNTDASTGSEFETPDVTRLTRPLSVLAFWSAILLPVVYVPLFLAGIATTAELVAFLGLFVLHVVALIAGRSGHRPSRSEPPDP